MAVTLVVLFANGTIHLNNPSRSEFPVRGVDVSHYQGDIDWPVLAAQDIDFAFIKATEGSTGVDEQFGWNLHGARAAGLRVGAYHFFSFDSSAQQQAAHIVQVIPTDAALLPVTVDFEYYGDYFEAPPEVEATRVELIDLLDRLTEHYGKRPIVYATAEAYDRYLAGAGIEADIWIRDVVARPTLVDGRAWTFWQYSDRHRLDGYTGEEPFIDMNVFAGDQSAWEQYGR